jgi:hypothetical protein
MFMDFHQLYNGNRTFFKIKKLQPPLQPGFTLKINLLWASQFFVRSRIACESDKITPNRLTFAPECGLLLCADPMTIAPYQDFP